ncbi:DedA family protein [Novosphingobium mathurense]|uniref:Membrane protein DedA, SNARE-associated domain n=1 Tax=Novosphingobium mathurense TaxID=428990 RepID=A0A1U6GX70_9SPHN|nr:DedA family protein [Novosphingobium mathurense]SLJ88115.1 membrane protein DedA, SNARE-associated domain [Novosphingobium mathurense]
MDDWVIHLIEGGGYWGIALLMMIENLVPPIPSELIMGVAGIALARGTMAFLPVLAAGTLGCTLGNYMLFLAADRLGYERLHPVVERWGRWLTMEWHDVERAGRFFRRHGHWIVFVTRFMPMFRTMISIPAGLSHMGHVPFLLYTAAGAAVWNTLLLMGGRWLGHRFEQAGEWISWGTLALGVAMLAWYVWRVARWTPTAPKDSVSKR